MHVVPERSAPSVHREEPLRAALQELEIPVLSADRIAEYKQQKLEEVLKRRKPKLSWQIEPPSHEAERGRARAWAQRHNMDPFIVRYYITLLGTCISHVAGWAVREGLPQDAPLHVVDKVRQITSRIPSARVESEILMDEKRAYDPIIYAVLGTERHAFEVYDEPELESHMF